MRTFLTIAALAATTAFAAPAVAAPSSDTITANALLIQPATLQRVDDLNFGTIIATPASSGTVTVAPDGTRSISIVSGTLVAGPGAAVRGRFVGNGNPTGLVSVTTNFPTYLSNTSDVTKTVGFSGTLNADAADGSVTIGATGVFYVDVGGTISVSTNQMPGLYSGDLTVTADFQ